MHKNIINVGFFPPLFLVLFRKLLWRAFCNGAIEGVNRRHWNPFLMLMKEQGPLPGRWGLLCIVMFPKPWPDGRNIWVSEITNQGSYLLTGLIHRPIKKSNVVFINLTMARLLCFSGKILHSTVTWKMRGIFPPLTMSKYLLPQGSEIS